jgi:hypothetical protein
MMNRACNAAWILLAFTSAFACACGSIGPGELRSDTTEQGVRKPRPNPDQAGSGSGSSPTPADAGGIVDNDMQLGHDAPDYPFAPNQPTAYLPAAPGETPAVLSGTGLFTSTDTSDCYKFTLKAGQTLTWFIQADCATTTFERFGYSYGGPADLGSTSFMFVAGGTGGGCQSLAPDGGIVRSTLAMGIPGQILTWLDGDYAVCFDNAAGGPNGSYDPNQYGAYTLSFTIQ